MFKRKSGLKKEEEERIRATAVSSHEHLLREYCRYSEGLNTADKIFLLDYLIDTILDDVCTQRTAEPLFEFTSPPNGYPFPVEYYDANGERREILSSGTVKIDLADVHVLSCPYSYGKLFANLLNIRDNGFIDNAGARRTVYYFTDVDLCFVADGNHSINAGRYLRKGGIAVGFFDIPLLYPHLYTDGAFWYNSHTEEYLYGKQEPRRSVCDDFRLAAVYTLARERHGLRAGNDTEEKTENRSDKNV